MVRLFLTLAVLLSVPTAAAHGDARALEEGFVLDVGESQAFVREVHYHRIMGSVRTHANATIVLEVEGETAAGPGRHLRVDHLVDCCRDVTWTEHTLTVRNVGQAPARVAVDLRLLHDDFAVVADNAEPGALWQTFVIVTLAAAVPAWLATRPRPQDGQAAQRWQRLAARLQGAAWGAAVALSVAGMLTYGVGPLRGHLGAAGWLFLPSRAISTHTVLAVALMATWMAGAVCWSLSHRAGGPRRLGYAVAAGPLLVGLLFAIEYRAAAAAMALVPTFLLGVAAVKPRSK